MMKYLMLLVLLIGISFTAQTQDSQAFFGQLTEKYADKDGFSASILTNDMFDLYLKKKNLDKDSEIAAALSNLDKILVVSQSGYAGPAVLGQKFDQEEYEKQKDANKKERDVMYNEILDHYKKSGYSLFKTEKRMGEEVKVYLKKDNDEVNSLALITNSSAATNLVELDGTIDLANVASLNSALNLRGLESLYKIDNRGNWVSGAELMRGYQFDEQHMAEIAAKAREMAEKAKLSDEQIAEIEKQAQMQFEKQRQMAEKYREMAEKYRVQPIFLNYPGDSTEYYLNGKKATLEEIKELDKADIDKMEITKPEKEGEKTVIKIKTK